MPGYGNAAPGTAVPAQYGAPAQYAMPAQQGMPAQQSSTPPNWYPDPQDPTKLRWWDGQAWTAQTEPRY